MDDETIEQSRFNFIGRVAIRGHRCATDPQAGQQLRLSSETELPYRYACWRDSFTFGVAEIDFDNRIPAGHAAFFNSFPYTRLGYSSAASMTKCKKCSMMLLEIESVQGEQFCGTAETHRLAWSGVQLPGNGIKLRLGVSAQKINKSRVS